MNIAQVVANSPEIILYTFKLYVIFYGKCDVTPRGAIFELARFVYISFVFLITFRLHGNRYGGYIHAVCFINRCQVPCRHSCRQAVGPLLLQALQVTFCPNMIHFHIYLSLSREKVFVNSINVKVQLCKESETECRGLSTVSGKFKRRHQNLLDWAG